MSTGTGKARYITGMGTCNKINDRQKGTRTFYYIAVRGRGVVWDGTLSRPP